MSRGKKAIEAAIATAVPAAPSSDGAAVKPPAHIAKRFAMKAEGLFRRSLDDDKPDLWVCGPFTIEGETTEDDGKRWGLLIAWADRDGRTVSEIFSRALFVGDGNELRARLAEGGLAFNSISAARQSFTEYLNLVSSPARVRVVAQTGWHQVGRARVFVLPDEVFGQVADRVMLQSVSREPSAFNAAGTLSEWRASIAHPAIGNTRIVFAIACAFAGPLLDPLGEDGGGFHFRGKAQIGKTTALRVAASVWGGAPGPGAAGFISTWRATANGIEGLAAARSGTLLLLDEMGSADAKQIGEAAYMLANGQGKARADRNGSARPPMRWRVLFLSTGELALADKSLEAKQQTFAGQEVRLVNVAADTGAHGLFDTLGNMPNPAALSTALRDATRRCYGIAGPILLRHLADQRMRDPDHAETLRRKLDAAATEILRQCRDAGGQVRSVARRFALVAIAGELATEVGLTGWTPGEAMKAASRLFAEWLTERGTEGAAEDLAAKLHVRAFISRHRESKFTLIERLGPGEQNDDSRAPRDRFHVQNAAGYRVWEFSGDEEAGWGYVYYFTTDGMREALTGLDFKPALRALVHAGVVIPGHGGKTAVSMRLPGMQNKARLYKVPGTILGIADDLDDEPRSLVADRPLG